MLLEVEESAGLSRSLYAATFFQEPTLSTLATMVTAAIAGHTEASSNAIRLVPVCKGSGRLPLYMIPSNGEEGYGFRRLARVLGDAWPLALVRPETCWHERSVTSLEEAAVQAAEAIRAAKPPGPCLVGGYCYGGVVAYETVRQLESRGEVALLVLFDVPTPGRPHVIVDWRLYLKVAAAAGKACRQSRRLTPALDFADSFARRLAWSAVRRVYPTNATLRRWAPLRWLGSHARDKYFPFYRPGPVSAPLLHFLVEREPELLRAGSRLGWHRMAPAGTTVHWLPCDHTGVFDEAGLTQIASAIESWPALTQAAAL
jgi:thioesterase domain-containing protein